jgi:hypothetical protein
LPLLHNRATTATIILQPPPPSPSTPKCQEKSNLDWHQVHSKISLDDASGDPCACCPSSTRTHSKFQPLRLVHLPYYITMYGIIGMQVIAQNNEELSLAIQIFVSSDTRAKAAIWGTHIDPTSPNTQTRPQPGPSISTATRIRRDEGRAAGLLV